VTLKGITKVIGDAPLSRFSGPAEARLPKADVEEMS
jgi:hypothetical protein